MREMRELVEKYHNMPGLFEEANEEEIKNIKGCKSRCILEDGEHIDDKCVCCGKEAKHHVVWGLQY